MAEQPFNVTMVSASKPKPEPTSLPSTDGNNVSFVNITYTIQPQHHLSLKLLFVKLPPKKILDDVRYVKVDTIPTHVCYAVYGKTFEGGNFRGCKKKHLSLEKFRGLAVMPSFNQTNE